MNCVAVTGRKNQVRKISSHSITKGFAPEEFVVLYKSGGLYIVK